MRAQVTASFEEIIKQRIKDNLYDDVVRTAALQPARYRPKAAEISTEKSKLGLGEEYAKDYEQQILGAASAGDTANAAAHAALAATFQKLSAKLDALFSFHAMPKPHKREATVRSAMSTVRMEEATPSAMASDAALAPEEVYAAKKGDRQLASREELSQQERKALRRRKKRVRKRRTAERDEADQLRAKLQPDSGAAKRLEAKAADKALADAKRKGTVIEGTAADGAKGNFAGSQFTRSAQFFKNMQSGAASAAAGLKRRVTGSSGAEEGQASSKRYKL